MTNPRIPYIFGEVLFDCFDDGACVLGGAPFNVAWNMQVLGDRPSLVSRVGYDELGSRIVAAMEAWDMDTSSLQRDRAHPTGRVQVNIVNGEPHYDILQDCAYDFIALDSLPELAEGAVVYHGTLALRNETSRRAMDALAENPGVSIFVDVNLRDPWWEEDPVHDWLERARWAKLNKDELLLLSGGDGDIPLIAQRLQARHSLEMLVVTLGEDGALACGSGGKLHRIAPVPAESIVDTVGAGDAFSSMVLHGLLRDWPVEVILSKAQMFARSVLSLRGATTTDMAFYNQLRNTLD